MNNSSVIPFPQRPSSSKKSVPQSLEAEQSTIGAMLLERDTVARAVEILTVDDFYRELHKKIFKSVLKLFDNGEPIGVTTVAEDLRKNGKLEEVGGIEYLSALIEACPKSPDVVAYIKILRDKSIRRNIMDASTDIQDVANNSDISINEVIQQSKDKILEATESKANLSKIDSVIAPLHDHFSFNRQLPPRDKGLSTGFVDLDHMTLGLHPTDFIIVAARPSVGKTLFCLNIARHIALKERQPIAIFSLDMSKDQLTQILISGQAGVKLRDLRRGNIQDGDWHRITNAVNNLYQSPIFIDDESGQSSSEMRAKARRLTEENGQLGLIVVDYLQLVRSSGKSENRMQEISNVAHELKLMAKELNCPVIALSQLPRAVEQREDKRPMLSDLSTIGLAVTEAEADVVAFIYRASYYRRKALVKDGQPAPQSEPDPDEGIAEVIIGKQRNGPVGTIKLGFQPEYARFTNLSVEDYGGGY